MDSSEIQSSPVPTTRSARAIADRLAARLARPSWHAPRPFTANQHPAIFATDVEIIVNNALDAVCTPTSGWP